MYTIVISFTRKCIYPVFGPSEFLDVIRKLPIENPYYYLELHGVIKDTSFCISLHGLNPHFAAQ